MAEMNPWVTAVTDPPVTISRRWLAETPPVPGLPTIELAQAAPSYPPAEALREHLAELALRPEVYGYVLGVGLEHVRAAIAGDAAGAYGAAIDAEDVVVTAGCNQAFCLVIGALCAAGDEVVVPTPYYFDHDMWLRAEAVTPVYVATGADFVPDPGAIAAAITDRTRAIVLVTPNNPTGAEYPSDCWGSRARSHPGDRARDPQQSDGRGVPVGRHRGHRRGGTGPRRRPRPRRDLPRVPRGNGCAAPRARARGLA
jgi:hypothetical protein